METTKTIIDTDILIDLLRNKKEAVAFIANLEEKKVLLTTTVINAFELHYGAHKSRQPQKNLQATKKLLSRLDCFAADAKVSSKSRSHIRPAGSKRPNHRPKRHHNRRNHHYKRTKRSDTQHRTLPKNHRPQNYLTPRAISRLSKGESFGGKSNNIYYTLYYRPVVKNKPSVSVTIHCF